LRGRQITPSTGPGWNSIAQTASGTVGESPASRRRGTGSVRPRRAAAAPLGRLDEGGRSSAAGGAGAGERRGARRAVRGAGDSPPLPWRRGTGVRVSARCRFGGARRGVARRPSPRPLSPKGRGGRRAPLPPRRRGEKDRARVQPVVRFLARQHLARPPQHRRRHARQPGDVDARNSWSRCPARSCAGTPPRRPARAPPRCGLRKAGSVSASWGQLVVVRGEEAPGSRHVVEVLGDRPGQGHAVVGAGAAADLVEDNEALGRALFRMFAASSSRP